MSHIAEVGKMVASLSLPFPPSVNSYWRHPTTGRFAGMHLISEKGRAYRIAVSASVICARAEKGVPLQALTGRLSVCIRVYPPDKRRRDIDNILKSLLDALTYADVWIDDNQIDRLLIERMPDLDGRVTVEIEAVP